MILSEAVEAYILHKRSLGMGFRGEAVRLRAFVQAVGDRNMRLVKPEQVLRFLEGKGPITSFWFAKDYTLNPFYRYAIARKYCLKSPLPLSMPQKPEMFQPYIYTNRDIERCAAQAARHNGDGNLLRRSVVRCRGWYRCRAGTSPAFAAC